MTLNILAEAIGDENIPQKYKEVIKAPSPSNPTQTGCNASPQTRTGRGGVAW